MELWIGYVKFYMLNVLQVSHWKCLNNPITAYCKINAYTGMPMADKERNAPVHYTWEQSSYLATRREELADILKDIEPFKPVSEWFCSCIKVADIMG